MKLFRIVLIVVLLASGFAFFSPPQIASAECISGSGNGDGTVLLGPYSLPAGATIHVTMTTDAGAGTVIGILANGAWQVWDEAYVASRQVTHTLSSDATDIYIVLIWQYITLASNTWSVSSNECSPGPDMVPMPSNAVVGVFLTSTELLGMPDATAGTGLVMEAGQTLWVFGVDESGMYYQVLLSGKLLWVPVDSVGPNYDDTWNGAPLPATVVE